MNILCYGFGTTPIFFRALIDYVNCSKINWSIILPQSNHAGLFTEVILPENILCLYEEMAKLDKEQANFSILRDYPSNIFFAVESEKITLKNRPSSKQHSFVIRQYLVIKSFLQHQKPDIVIYAQPPEGIDGILLGQICKELNIKLAVPHHLRNIDRSFFADTEQEVFPVVHRRYDESKKWAESFLDSYKHETNFSTQDTPDSENEIYSIKFPSRSRRVLGFIKRFITEPDNREIGMLRVSLLNSWAPFLRDLIRGVRKRINRKIYNVSNLSDLPEKYIFYPLQYTPESSINVPAPYFVDQLRIVDAIRFSMPNDCVLVVKEHPVCLEMRNPKFLKTLTKKAGVLVLEPSVNTKMVIENAALTISVTGTASWEAFLLGKPSLVMADVFFANFLGGVCKFDELPRRLRDCIGSHISRKQRICALEEIYNGSAQFLARAPDGDYSSVMAKRNISTFWRELCERFDLVYPINELEEFKNLK